MRKAAAFLALAVASTSCSPLFMETLPSNYDGRTEPRCTVSKGWPVIDGLGAALNVVGVLAAVDAGSGEGLILANVVAGVINAASMAWGIGRANECDAARGQWDSEKSGDIDPRWSEPIAPPPQPGDATPLYCVGSKDDTAGGCAEKRLDCEAKQFEIERSGKETFGCTLKRSLFCFATKWSDDADADVSSSCFPTRTSCESGYAEVVVNPERYTAIGECAAGERAGVADLEREMPEAAVRFYCTSDPDGESGSCARSIEGCELAQDALLAAGKDATPCVEASVAVCFSGASGERCFPTVGTCRTEWATVDDVVTDCADAR